MAACAPLSPKSQKPPGSASVIMTTNFLTLERIAGLKSPICRGELTGVQFRGFDLPLAASAFNTVFRHSSVLSGVLPPPDGVTLFNADVKADRLSDEKSSQT